MHEQSEPSNLSGRADRRGRRGADRKRLRHGPRSGHALLQRKRDPERFPLRWIPSRSGLIRIRFTVSDDAGYITYLELTTYCQQSYPVTTVFSENSWSKTAHTPLTFSVKANQQNNTSGFTIRYELLKGAGDMYYGGIKLSDGQSLTSGANDPGRRG